MASLNIDFSYDDNVKRSINGAKSSLSTRINDYAGIKRNLSNMSSSTGNLSTANTHIQKKINALQSKYDKLESFRTAVTNFNTNAEAADRRVANRINTETNQFYKREGIQTGILYTIGSVLGKGADWLRGKIEEAFDAFITGAKTVWANIKQWYEDNKHWIDVVVDVVCVIAAAVATIAAVVALATATAVTGGLVLGAVCAAWGLAKSVADLCYDSTALSYYNQGDIEKYEEMSEKGLKDFMSGKLGPVGEFAYYGMEVVSMVYGVYKLGSGLVKTGKQLVTDYKKLYVNDILRTAKLSDTMKKQIIISDMKDMVLVAIGFENVDTYTGKIKFGTAVDTVNSLKKLSGNGKWVITGMHSLLKEDSEITAVINTIKITKTAKDIYNKPKDFLEWCAKRIKPIPVLLMAGTVPA